MVGKAWSSLLWREIFSWKVGEGARVLGVVLKELVGGSEKERFLVGVLVEGEAVSALRGRGKGSIVVSIVQCFSHTLPGVLDVCWLFR